MKHDNDEASRESVQKAQAIEEVEDSEKNAAMELEREKEHSMKEMAVAREKAEKIIIEATESTKAQKEKEVARLLKEMDLKRKKMADEAASGAQKVRKRSLSQNARDGIVRSLVSKVRNL